MNSFLKPFAVIAILVVLGLWSSCRKDFDYAPSTGNLQFSKDTVFLDTIFTNIGSATYTLKVFNRSNEDLLIPFVGLETGQTSSYRLNVDGQSGKEFSDIPILAKDSLFVFIETTFDVSQVPENEFLYTESLLFGTSVNQQKVELVTLVKDAVFLYPATLSNGTKETLVLGLDENGNEIRIEGFFLEADELQFTNEKPYVIYGYASVPNGNTLTIDAGARVHFHKDSGLLVGSGASLLINGLPSEDQELLENEVIFEGDRLEPAYSDIPGQWGTVWLREGSINNQIEHLTIKNATVGLRVEGDGILSEPTLVLKNSQILNSQSFNLWATTSYINAQNSVLGSSGNSAFFASQGGKYSFVHCTLANYWNDTPRNWPTLTMDNALETPLEQADFINCIIDGTLPLELSLLENPNIGFNFLFQNCLLKFNDTNNEFENNPLYDFSDVSRYQNILLNQDPDFKDPFQGQFEIGLNSAAIDAANPSINPPIPIDLLGNERNTDPDIGAYEIVKEN